MMRWDIALVGEEGQSTRLQKVLAEAGVASRRHCEELIRLGRVAVNGRVVTRMGTQVGPQDEVTLDGQPIGVKAQFLYLMLHKPPGYLSTVSDPYGRPTVIQLVARQERLFPVGRLDADSEGLLLLTNDGELAYRLTHPRYAIEKEYRVLVQGYPGKDALRQLREGIELEGRKTSPARVWPIEPTGSATWLGMAIHEGRKRQIRRLWDAVGHPVLRLIRVRVGPLALGTLPPGRCRELTADEVRALRQKRPL